MNEKPTIPDNVKKHPAWYRLEDQQKWYDDQSILNQKRYKQLKLIQIVTAALIPLISLMGLPLAKYTVALFGAVIVVLESIQQLYQYHTLWTEYRSTAEHLKHERYLFLSLSGPYRELDQEKALIVLSERIEENISKEHSKWIDQSKNHSQNMKSTLPHSGMTDS